MGIQNGEIKGHYGALERLLPELLVARSVMYVPVLLLLYQRNKMTLPVVVRQLQAARNLIGRGTVQAVMSMMMPEMVVPESPRLDVQLFGVPQVKLDGWELELSARAMVLLAVMITQGAVSTTQLTTDYRDDFSSSNICWKAITTLRIVLSGESEDADMISQSAGGRGMYGLQRFDLHCDYTDLPHMTPAKRQSVLLSPFLQSSDSVFALQIRSIVH